MSKLNQIKNAFFYLHYLSNPYLDYLDKNKKMIVSLSIIYSISVYLNNLLFIFHSILVYYMYWFSLGILSTIGLGFGFHTGIFFLFPHIIEIYSLSSNPSFIMTLFKTLPEIVLWGVGSALGELPPYLITKNSDSIIEYPNMIKKYIHFINFKSKRCVFFALLIMSSWPNFTFDMCGMLCGYNNIELKAFLIPTIIGKSLIKAPIQCLVILYLYSRGEIYSIPSNQFTILFNIGFIGFIVYFMNKLIETLSKKYINLITTI